MTFNFNACWVLFASFKEFIMNTFQDASICEAMQLQSHATT